MLHALVLESSFHVNRLWSIATQPWCYSSYLICLMRLHPTIFFKNRFEGHDRAIWSVYQSINLQNKGSPYLVSITVHIQNNKLPLT